MNRYKIAFYTLLVLVLLAIGAFIFWKVVKAPTNEPQTSETTPTPTPSPVETPVPPPVNPTPAPTPSNIPTTGTLVGTADTATLHITKIIVYNSTGKTQVATANLAGDGSFSISLNAGDYMIDYVASPDLYPHSKEKFTIKGGQTHEVDFQVQSN